MKDNNFNFNQVFLNTIDSEASEQLLSFLHLNNISANISEKSLSILLAKASFAFLLISMLSYWFHMSFKSQRLRNSSPTEMNPEGYIEDLHITPQKLAQRERNSERIVLTSCVNELIFSKGNPVTKFESGYSIPFGSGVREANHLQEADHKSKASTYNKTDRKNLYYFLEKVPFVSMWSANITLALLLSIRWVESGHFPLSNLYESLIFLSWSLTVIHLFLENLFNKREQREPSTLKILGSEAELGLPPTKMNQRVWGTQIHSSTSVAELRTEGSGTPTLTLGAITSPVALFTNAFATFSLPQEMQKVTVLVPALKSNWLIMHVSVMIISYAALLSGSLLAMAFLVIKFIDDSGAELRRPRRGKEIPSIMSTFINPLPLHVHFSGGYWSKSLRQLLDRGVIFIRGKKQPLQRYTSSLTHHTQAKSSICTVDTTLSKEFQKEFLEDSSGFSNYSSGYQESEGSEASEPLLLAQRGNLIKENKVLLPQILDNLSYRSIGLGFALLTIGILSGAVWANEAWGSYWSWDPKETWALITWLVFALYLHTRLSKGWVGKESAFVASFGFIVIWFCYLGVNLFGKGLHSYGWFQQ